MPRMNLKTILIGTASVIGIVFVAAIVWFFLVTQNLPSEEQLRNYEPPIMSRVHAGDGKLVAEYRSSTRLTSNSSRSSVSIVPSLSA